MKDRLISFYSKSEYRALDMAGVEEKFKDDIEICRQVSARMRKQGELVVLTPGYCVLKKYHDKALDELRDMAAAGEDITIASFKERLGISRKYSQMFLEYWDTKAVTRRVGDVHILRRDQRLEVKRNENSY